jgi:hypothetical protein
LLGFPAAGATDDEGDRHVFCPPHPLRMQRESG